MTKRKRSSWARVLLYFILAMGIIHGCFRGYEMYQMHRQIAEAEAIRARLLEEKAALEKERDDLQNLQVIEQKARDDLGMVRPGEVPYVK